jgi:hypothetical protein
VIDGAIASYGVIACQDGVVLLQRGQSNNPEALASWQSFRQTL